MPRHTATQGQMTTSGFDGVAYGAYHATKPNDSIQAVVNQMDNFTRLQGEPCGLVTQDDTYTQISWNDATKTFQVAPVGASFDVWAEGRRFVFALAQTVDISLVIAEGLWYFYFDNTGALVGSQTPWDLSTDAPMGALYWDNTNVQSINFVDYRSGIYMPWASQKEVEDTEGLKYVDGLDITGNTSGDGSADSHAQIDVDPGTMYVGDIEIGVTDGAGGGRFEQQLTLPAQLPIFYLDGANPDWRFYAADNFPVQLDGAVNRIEYNLDTAGNWTQPAATGDGKYVAAWIYGTNDYREPIFAIMGQREDSTLADAKANNTPESLTLPALYPYMKLLYRLIFITDSTFTNATFAALRDIRDYRTVTSGSPLHAPTHSAGAEDPVSVENLATGMTVTQAALSDGAGGLTARYSAGARVIYTDEDAAAIINAAVAGDAFLLANGTHTLSAQVTITSKDRITVLGCGRSTQVDVSGLAVVPFWIGADTDDLEIGNFEVVSTVDHGFIKIDPAGAGSCDHHYIHDIWAATNGAATGAAVWIDYYVQAATAKALNNIRVERIVDSDRGFKGDCLVRIRNEGGQGLNMITVRDCVVRNPSATAGAVGWAIDVGNTVQAVWQCNITGNMIEKFGGGIRVQGPNQAVVTDNNMTAGGTNGGIYLLAGQKSVVVGNTIRGLNSAGDAIAVENTDGTTVVGNYIDGGDRGIYVTSSNRCVVTGNSVVSSNTDAISINSDNCLVAGNMSNDPGGRGIYLASSVSICAGNACYSAGGTSIQSDGNNSVIVGNSIDAPAAIGIDVNGTYSVVCGNSIDEGTVGIDSNGEYSLVVGNMVDNTSSYGIQMQAGADRSLVGSNYIYSSGDTGILNQGQEVGIVGNYVRQPAARGIDTNGGTMAIVGNYIGIATTQGIYLGGGSDKSVVVGNSVNDGTNGIELANSCDEVNVTGNYVYNVSGNGIEIGNCGYILCNCNFFDTCGGIGISSTGGQNASIVGNIVKTTTGDGIAIENVDCMVANNYVAAAGVRGIDVGASAAYARVCGNYVDTATAQSIYVDAANAQVNDNYIVGGSDGIYVNAAGCHVGGNFVRATSSEAIVLSGSADYASVEGNYLHLTGGTYGVLGLSNCDNVRVSGNFIYDPTVGIQMGGDNCLVEGNYVYSSSSSAIVVSDYSLVVGNFIDSCAGTAISLGPYSEASSNMIHDHAGSICISAAGAGCNVVGNSIFNAAAVGISVSSPAGQNSVIASNFIWGGTIGVDCNATYVLISGNRLQSTTGVGIDISSAACHVVGNHLSSIQNNVGVLTTGQYTTIQANLITGPGGHGIHLSQADDCMVVGNHVFGVGGTTQHGIFVDQSERAMVNNNRVRDVDDGNGIHCAGEVAVTEESQVNDNYVDTATTGIALVDTDATNVSGNRVINCTTGITEDANSQDNLFGVNHLMGNTNALSQLGANATTSGNKTA